MVSTNNPTFIVVTNGKCQYGHTVRTRSETNRSGICSCEAAWNWCRNNGDCGEYVTVSYATCDECLIEFNAQLEATKRRNIETNPLPDNDLYVHDSIGMPKQVRARHICHRCKSNTFIAEIDYRPRSYRDGCCEICKEKSECIACEKKLEAGPHKPTRCNEHAGNAIKYAYNLETQIFEVAITEAKCSQDACQLHIPKVTTYTYTPDRFYDSEHDCKTYNAYICKAIIGRKCTHCDAVFNTDKEDQTRCDAHMKLSVCCKCNELFPRMHFAKICDKCVSPDIKRTLCTTGVRIKYKICQDGKHKPRQETFNEYSDEYNEYQFKCTCHRSNKKKK